MATSGTRTFALDVDEAILEAFELAGLEYRTGYDARAARRSMNVMFADWSNRGVQMWEVEQVSLDLVEGTTSYTLNAFDIDILDAVIRRTVGSTQTDFEIDRIDRNEYLNIPIKNTKARPTQFYFEKTTTPKLYLWPAPENSTDVLVFNKIVRMDDADTAINTMDMPFRFYPCFAAGLAYYLSVKKAPEKTPILKQMYEEEFDRASSTDEDRASFRIRPYTR